MIKKHKKIKTVLDLPFDESIERLSSIVEDVYNIVGNPKFVDAISNTIKVPENATAKQLKEIYYGKEVASRLTGFIKLFLVEEKESLINILATIFCQNKDDYRKKSVKQIMADINCLTAQTKGELVSFFTQR